MTALSSTGGSRVPTRPVSAASEEKLMAVTLAALFAAGATLALITLLTPSSGHANKLGLLVIVGNAYLVSALLFWRARRLPRVALSLTLAWGSTLIAGVAYFSGQRPSPLICFYLWVFLFASYFLSRRDAIAQILYAGGTYAALLALHPPQDGIVEWWLVVMGALTVAAVLTGVMRERVESLIGRLYDTARTDPLTGLPNRLGFREMLDRELQRARRANAAAAVLLGDLDHFRNVNDRAGHQVGDTVLQRLAIVLSETKREIDAAARVDGEEFALILPQTNEHGGLLAAERLRTAVQEAFRQEEVPVTISFGVACFPNHAHTSASLLRAADDALQLAKRGGGNRATAHDPAAALRAQGIGVARRDIEAERFLALMLDLAEAVDLRFSGSARHSETVGRYAEMVARELELGEERIARVRLAGMLHDIGKIGVPDCILRKCGPLTDEEFTVIKAHPGLGAQIIDHPSLADVSKWVGAHHERPDGRGYPNRCSGDQVPLEARIIAVVDAYEAMTSDRSYRSSIGHLAAREELARCAGSQFDEHVVGALLAALRRESQRFDAPVVEV
jgi:diguanylate cyclase (GGDEF)-like protein